MLGNFETFYPKMIFNEQWRNQKSFQTCALFGEQKTPIKTPKRVITDFEQHRNQLIPSQYDFEKFLKELFLLYPVVCMMRERKAGFRPGARSLSSCPGARKFDD